MSSNEKKHNAINARGVRLWFELVGYGVQSAGQIK